MTSLRCVVDIRPTLSGISETVSRKSDRGALSGRNSESPIRKTSPLVDLLLSSGKTDAVARCALGDLPSRLLAREHRLGLSDQQHLEAKIEKTRQRFEAYRSGTRRRTTGA